MNIIKFICHFSAQKQYEEAKVEAAKASQETERLLQVVQMTQEEQNAKEKTIMDLQQYESITNISMKKKKNFIYVY